MKLTVPGTPPRTIPTHENLPPPPPPIKRTVAAPRRGFDRAEVARAQRAFVRAMGLQQGDDDN